MNIKLLEVSPLRHFFPKKETQFLQRMAITLFREAFVKSFPSHFQQNLGFSLIQKGMNTSHLPVDTYPYYKFT